MIYLDNAATTRVLPEVYDTMKPYFCEYYGNPSSIYRFAGGSLRAVDEARERVASLIHAEAREIYFTGSGSESDNWALKAAAEAYRGKHIITTKIEHHAVLHTCRWLEEQGYRVTYLDVDGKGFVSPRAVEEAICPDTILISVMTANNEIGTMEPVGEIGAVAKRHGILFHTDAVQAFGHTPLDVKEMNIDLLSASAHKFHGPKGVGILYCRRGVKLGSLIHGGAQERNRRAGTHNVPGIVGMGKAAELAGLHMEVWSGRERSLRDHLIDRILAEIPYVRLDGDREKRLPGNAHFCFRFVERDSLLISLDYKGVCASGGSACASGSVGTSHVLRAMGLSDETAHGALRLTLSEENTREEVDYVVDELKKIIDRLRGRSPRYREFVEGGRQ